jgi:integrase
MLRVSPNGVKSFAVLFSARGKRAPLTLGKYPRVSLAQARGLALEAQSKAKDGEDPRYSQTGTVGELLPVYFAEHVRPNLRSAKAVERRLNRNVLDVIGSVPLAELHRRDINRVVTAVVARGSRTEAARVFEDLRALLRWAVARGDLDANPSEGMRRPQTPGPRERVLSDEEIRTLWQALPEALPRSPTVRDIIMLCLLTGQRVGEVAGITSREIDERHHIWKIPGSRSKSKYEHSVPLTDTGLDLANAIAGAPKLPSHAIAKIVRRAQPHFGIAQWTVHDLRRTVVTRMAELGIAPIVLGHVINHRSVTKAGVTLSVYSQHSYEREKREALELWADRLSAIVSGATAKIVGITRGSAGAA